MKPLALVLSLQLAGCIALAILSEHLEVQIGFDKLRIMVCALAIVIIAGAGFLYIGMSYQPTPLVSTHFCVKLCWYIAFVACGGPLGLFSVSKLSFGSSLGNVNFAVTAGASVAAALTVLHHLRYFNNEYTKLYLKQQNQKKGFRE